MRRGFPLAASRKRHCDCTAGRGGARQPRARAVSQGVFLYPLGSCGNTDLPVSSPVQLIDRVCYFLRPDAFPFLLFLSLSLVTLFILSPCTDHAIMLLILLNGLLFACCLMTAGCSGSSSTSGRGREGKGSVVLGHDSSQAPFADPCFLVGPKGFWA